MFVNTTTHLNVILKAKGSNHYIESHKEKRFLEDNGRLHIQVKASSQVIQYAIYLINKDANSKHNIKMWQILHNNQIKNSCNY